MTKDQNAFVDELFQLTKDTKIPWAVRGSNSDFWEARFEEGCTVAVWPKAARLTVFHRSPDVDPFTISATGSKIEYLIKTLRDSYPMPVDLPDSAKWNLALDCLPKE